MTNPVLRDVPTQIETARLLIRCPQPGDGLAHYAGVIDSLYNLRRFQASLSWVMSEPSLQGSEQYCRESQAGFLFRNNMPLLLFLKKGNTLVGSIGLHSFDWSVPECEIEFWGRAGYYQQGIATEAVKAITAFAIISLGIRRIKALPDNENLPSCLVCERAGFRLEGILRNERTDPNGILSNTRMYTYIQ